MTLNFIINNLPFFLSPTATIFPFFMNVHFFWSQYCRTLLLGAAPAEKRLKLSSSTWKTLLRYFRTHCFPLKARMSIFPNPIAWIYFPSPILIFSTVLNFLYDENHLRRFNMFSAAPESMCHESLNASKLYFADIAPISASPFFSVYFSFGVAAFRFLHSLIQWYPGL